MGNVFAEFMKELGVNPKLRFLGEKKELIFVGAVMTVKTDPMNKEKTALKITVRDRADGEIKDWVTESITVADALRAADIQPKMLFTVQPTKNGAKKGYVVEVKGFINSDGAAE